MHFLGTMFYIRSLHHYLTVNNLHWWTCKSNKWVILPYPNFFIRNSKDWTTNL